jgi:hypothetical protein
VSFAASLFRLLSCRAGSATSSCLRALLLTALAKAAASRLPGSNPVSFSWSFLCAVKRQTPSMAVVIQLQLDPSASGVLFTLNPLTGNTDQTVIESCWGLGEGANARVQLIVHRFLRVEDA